MQKIRRSFSTQVLKSTPPLTLEKVIGSTSSSNAVFQSSPINGDIFYAAGAIVVCYSPIDNIQKKYFKCSRSVSCIAVSSDGRYLAAGERGHMPSIVVWDIESEEKLVELEGHKHGVGCLEFFSSTSPSSSEKTNNNVYLVSVGFKHDNQLILWDWRKTNALATHKVGNKVNCVAFSNDGTFFITAGDKHLKWWYFNKDQIDSNGQVELVGKPASILESHKNSNFTDIQIGDGSIYCSTTDGKLCVFQENRMMEKWVGLEAAASYSLSYCATEDLLTVGCANGLIRMFKASTLDYVTTLPLPPAIGADDVASSSGASGASGRTVTENDNKNKEKKYPACYTTRFLRVHGTDPILVANYADNTMVFWELKKKLDEVDEVEFKVNKLRSFAAHTSCIWDIHFLDCFDVRGPSPQKLIEQGRRDDGLPPGSFVTCSSDNTIRFWNVDGKIQRRSKWRTNFSRELLHVIRIYSRGGHRNHSPGNLCEDIPDREIPDRPSDLSCPRSLAVHPVSRQLACGDRQGLLRIFDLNSMEQIKCTRAHDQEILTLSFSPGMHSSAPTESSSNGSSSGTGDSKTVWSTLQSDKNETPLVLLASAGRDRHIHLYDASPTTSEDKYKHLDTLADHSGSVTIVKFTPDGQRLISCGGDKSMTLNRVQGPQVTKIKSIKTPSGTINGLAIDATNKFAVTSGQDKRVNIWNIQSGRHVRAYKQGGRGELYKCDVDPSGMFVAACGFDKTVKILDFFSGDIVGEVRGHGEIITSIKFSPDGKYVVTVAGDGCIFVWKVGDLLVEAMKERIIELYSKFELKSQLTVSKQHVVVNPSNENVDTNVSKITNNAVSASSSNLIMRTPITCDANIPISAEVEASGNDENVPVTVFNKAIASAGKWGQRVPEKFEILGKKIDINDENINQLNQFTLEMTGASGISDIGSTDDNKLATSLEASDSVNLGDVDVCTEGLTDDDDDDDELAAFYGSDDFEEDDSLDKADDEAALEAEGFVLDSAGQRLDELEQQSIDIENHMEQIIRESQQCGNVDTPNGSIAAVVSAITDGQHIPQGKWGLRGQEKNQQERDTKSEGSDGSIDANAIVNVDTNPVDKESELFNRSLTSEFLEHQIKVYHANGNENDNMPAKLSAGDSSCKLADQSANAGVKDKADQHSIAPIIDTQNKVSTDNRNLRESEPKEIKSGQVLARMAQMKERLRVMGIPETHKEVNIESACSTCSSKTPVITSSVHNTTNNSDADGPNGEEGKEHNRIDLHRTKDGNADVDSGDETASESDVETDVVFPPPPPTLEFHVQMEKEMERQGLKIPSDQTLLTGLHAEDIQGQGFTFPSDKTLLNGLQAANGTNADTGANVDADSENKQSQSEADDVLLSSKSFELHPVPVVAATNKENQRQKLLDGAMPVETNDEMEPGMESQVNNTTEVDTNTSSTGMPEESETSLQQKMANCKRVVDEMVRLSVQAKQMYQEMRELAQANESECNDGASAVDGASAKPISRNSGDGVNNGVHESKIHLTTSGSNALTSLHQAQPPLPAFSPRRSKTKSSVSMHMLEEMEQSFHHLRLSMASISNILDSDGSPNNNTSIPTTAAASSKIGTSTSVATTHTESDSSVSINTASSNDNNSNQMNVDTILERYSDRIADMVSEKLSARMSNSMSMSASTHSLGIAAGDEHE